MRANEKSNTMEGIKKPETTGVTTEVPKNEYKMEIVWKNVILMSALHVISVYGLYLLITVTKWPTAIWTYHWALLSLLGITAGAHRLWSHWSYKATWQFRLILALCQTMAMQNDIYEWCRDHRVHHKFTETNADPHNATRGFFFSHVGWLMVKKHPDVFSKGKTVDMSDLTRDGIVMWQKTYYNLLVPVVSVIFPTVVPWYFWDENIWTALIVCAFTRYTVTLNITWLINSVSHLWGYKPYDKNIAATQNPYLTFLTMGEYGHNFHHVFPWDYRSTEISPYNWNLTRGFIEMFAKIGWVYDMKVATGDMTRRRALRTGDGTHINNNITQSGDNKTYGQEYNGNNVWGWGDEDMAKQDMQNVVVNNQNKLIEKAM